LRTVSTLSCCCGSSSTPSTSGAVYMMVPTMPGVKVRTAGGPLGVPGALPCCSSTPAAATAAAGPLGVPDALPCCCSTPAAAAGPLGVPGMLPCCCNSAPAAVGAVEVPDAMPCDCHGLPAAADEPLGVSAADCLLGAGGEGGKTCRAMPRSPTFICRWVTGSLTTRTTALWVNLHLSIVSLWLLLPPSSSSSNGCSIRLCQSVHQAYTDAGAKAYCRQSQHTAILLPPACGKLDLSQSIFVLTCMPCPIMMLAGFTSLCRMAGLRECRCTRPRTTPRINGSSFTTSGRVNCCCCCCWGAWLPPAAAAAGGGGGSGWGARARGDLLWWISMSRVPLPQCSSTRHQVPSACRVEMVCNMCNTQRVKGSICDDGTSGILGPRTQLSVKSMVICKGVLQQSSASLYHMPCGAQRSHIQWRHTVALLHDPSPEPQAPYA
jgi:hypothetical protein